MLIRNWLEGRFAIVTMTCSSLPSPLSLSAVFTFAFSLEGAKDGTLRIVLPT
jgi:hypothetical protein